jgi:hypothetical protein
MWGILAGAKGRFVDRREYCKEEREVDSEHRLVKLVGWIGPVLFGLDGYTECSAQSAECSTGVVSRPDI